MWVLNAVHAQERDCECTTTSRGSLSLTHSHTHTHLRQRLATACRRQQRGGVRGNSGGIRLRLVAVAPLRFAIHESPPPSNTQGDVAAGRKEGERCRQKYAATAVVGRRTAIAGVGAPGLGGGT